MQSPCSAVAPFGTEPLLVNSDSETEAEAEAGGLAAGGVCVGVEGKAPKNSVYLVTSRIPKTRHAHT